MVVCRPHHQHQVAPVDLIQGEDHRGTLHHGSLLTYTRDLPDFAVPAVVTEIFPGPLDNQSLTNRGAIRSTRAGLQSVKPKSRSTGQASAATMIGQATVSLVAVHAPSVVRRFALAI